MLFLKKQIAIGDVKQLIKARYAVTRFKAKLTLDWRCSSMKKTVRIR